MENHDLLAKVVFTSMTLSVSGFLFLCGCFWWLARQLPDVKKISTSLEEIKLALLGDLKTQGFISKLLDLERDITDLKRKLELALKRGGDSACQK